MAKKPNAENDGGSTGGRVTFATLSTKERTRIVALRRPVLEVAKNYGIVRDKLASIAAKVIGEFNTLKAAHAALSFVEYCRCYDETIPTHADDRDGAIGYRNHRVYYSMNYMRRLVERAGQQGGKAGGAGNGNATGTGVRSVAVDGLARTIATILQLMPEPEQLWKAVQDEFTLREGQMTRLRKRVADVQPLFKLSTPKPVTVGKVIHMDPNAKPDPMQQPGQRIEMPASGEAAPARKRARAS